jgi:hypothetical protein
MNFGSRTSAFAFTLALGGFCALGYLAQTTAQAQPARRGAVAPSPRYVYGPGYAGFGYYNYSAPGTAPAAAPPSAPTTRTFRVPASGSSNTGARRGRDWSTGRRMTIAKPWLKPMD